MLLHYTYYNHVIILYMLHPYCVHVSLLYPDNIHKLHITSIIHNSSIFIIYVYSEYY